MLHEFSNLHEVYHFNTKKRVTNQKRIVYSLFVIVIFSILALFIKLLALPSKFLVLCICFILIILGYNGLMILIEKGFLNLFGLGLTILVSIVFAWALIDTILNKTFNLYTIMYASYVVMGIVATIMLAKKPLHISNPFGIYEEGISPPTKPGKWKYRKGFFIPYKDIKNIKITNIWHGNKVPKRPFYFIIKTRDSNEFQISAGDLVVQYFGDNVMELKKVYELLCRVKVELENDENRKRFEKYEEIILKKELFNETLKKEYKIVPVAKRKTFFKH